MGAYIICSVQLTIGTSPALSTPQQACLLFAGRMKMLRSKARPAQGHAVGQRLVGREPKAHLSTKGKWGRRREGWRGRMDRAAGGRENGSRSIQEKEEELLAGGRETKGRTGSCGRGAGRGQTPTSGQQRHSTAKAGALAGPAPRGVRRYKTHWPPTDPEL